MTPGKLLLLISLIFLTTGCSLPGSNNFFGVDPVSGGVDAPVSHLLDISLPAGLQRYSGHGFINSGASGKEGLEVLRGPVDSRSTALSLFNTLKSHGWQLLGSQRKNSRAAYLYGKNGEHVIVSFRPQGNLTIVEIWRAGQLPPDSDLSMGSRSAAPEISLGGEEYGPLDGAAPVEEKWGVEEKEL